MDISNAALRRRGATCEAWSDRCVGGASAFLVAAVWSGFPLLYIPVVALGVTAAILFVLSMILGGRTL